MDKFYLLEQLNPNYSTNPPTTGELKGGEEREGGWVPVEKFGERLLRKKRRKRGSVRNW